MPTPPESIRRVSFMAREPARCAAWSGTSCAGILPLRRFVWARRARAARARPSSRSRVDHCHDFDGRNLAQAATPALQKTRQLKMSKVSLEMKPELERRLQAAAAR